MEQGFSRPSRPNPAGQAQMLKNLKVRTKLATVLAVPLVALVVVGALGVRDRGLQADDARSNKQLTELLAARIELSHQLQLERVWLSTNGTNAVAAREKLIANRGVTSAARVEFEHRMEAVHGVSTAVGAALDDATKRLASLDGVRTAAEQGNGTATALGTYDTALGALSRVNLELSRATTGTAQRDLVSLGQMNTLKGTVATISAKLTALITTTGAAPQLDAVRQLQVSADEQQRAFLADASDAARADFEAQSGAAGYQDSLAQQHRIFSTGADHAIPTDAVAWLNAVATQLTGLRHVEAVIANSAGTAAAGAESNASTRARNFALGVGAAVLVSLLLASLVARSIAKPLGRLTKAANSLASEGLPALVEQLRNPQDGAVPATLTEIPVESKDEIGQLARALNSIQGTTRSVADEQATLLRKGIGDIFVNLARRNQTLLDRQIAFIDHLEAAEENPDQLQNLFRLDHLSTRMRRNAESLLVLAGAEPPRRRGRPVELADVVRVAVGEVEHFSRIRLLSMEETTVSGAVAVDLAHLLSELMENASQFSPPETTVDVDGQRDADGNYVVTITDQGIGMNADQLVAANQTIARPPNVGLSISRALGYTVVGKLAQRHDLGVRMTSSADGGVVATVLLPASVTNAEPDDVAPSTVVDGDTAAVQASAPAASADVAVFAGPVAAPSVDVVDLFEHQLTAEPSESAEPTAASLAVPSSDAPPAPRSAPPSIAVTPPEGFRQPIPVPPATDRALEGLTRRVPRAEPATDNRARTTAAAPSHRSPDEVRQMLSRYRSGLKRGRSDDEQDETTGSTP